MNAPYDGDRGQGTGGSAAAGEPYPGAADPGQYPAEPDPRQYPSGTPEAAPYPGRQDSPYPVDPQQQRSPAPQPQHPAAAGPRQFQDAQPEAGQMPAQPYADTPDMYAQGTYAQDPYRAQPPGPQGPVAGGLYDPSPGGGDTQALYGQPSTSPYAPGPGVWAQSSAPEPQDPARQYGQDARTTQFVGVGNAGGEQQGQDAFAHLFRDQEDGAGRSPGDAPAVATTAMAGTAPVAEPAPAPPAQARSGGRAANLLKSSALMAAGTMVSRLTGFVRTIVITAALGSAQLGDAFTIAYTLPTMMYILTVGGGLNSVFVPQLVRSMKDDEDGGEAYANRLLTLVMVTLALITVVVVYIAPVLIRAQSPTIADDVAANSVAVTLARYCLPTIFFMGIHVVMGQILNARGKFGAMMWTPVLNNIVMISTFGLFIWVYGTSAETHMGVQTIPPEGIRLLGIGTLLGLVVQALAMIPYLREAGFRFRPRFDWRGHGLGKTVRLAKWTMLFVLANQAGLLVVTELSTAAGAASGHDGTGFLAYSNAQLIWAMPQAIITVSVMAAMLPRISRAAQDGDPGAVRDDISQGLRTSAVAIVPVSFAFVALGIPVCTLLYSSSGAEGAQSMGYILMAFGLGLIPYSVQYVVLRGFYAYEDTRTPFYNTVIVAIVNAAVSALCYVVLPARWAVIGMAGAYGLAYAVGVGVAWRRLRKRLGGDLDGAHVLRTYARLCLASLPAAVIGGVVGVLITRELGHGLLGSVTALIVGGVALLGVFYVAARRMRIEELNSMVGMVRGRLGR